jgi:hypothetical protein
MFGITKIGTRFLVPFNFEVKIKKNLSYFLNRNWDFFIKIEKLPNIGKNPNLYVSFT